MPSIVKSFLGFDHLIGPGLVKLVYYFAGAIILIMVGAGMVVGLFAIAGGNFGQGLVQIIAAPVVGLVALVYWRFICELFMLAFLAYERLGDVRRLMANATGQPDPDHPEF
ncbi:hypothetical protein U91I_03950 [alpha proteobacterium U9-1i]|nr:hypothetical protein U91I_03950 [alpha proteobacterium U9-1i]